MRTIVEIDDALLDEALALTAHLLTSLRSSPGCRLWTRDRRLHAAAASLRLGLAVQASA